MSRYVLAVLALLAVPLMAAAQSVTLTEWPVPWKDTRPRDPYVDGGGRVWFVGQVGNYIAYLEPVKGEFKRFEIEDGTHPHNLIVDNDGMVWYAGNQNARIGRLDPATGAVKTFMMPDTLVRDPHTLVFDQAGHIWFTAQGGNHVGRLDKASGKIDLVKVATPRARPYGIVIDSRGDAWVNLFATNKLARVDAVTLKIEEITLPHAEARTRRIGITRDGAVWYVDYMRGYLAGMTPSQKHSGSGLYRAALTAGRMQWRSMKRIASGSWKPAASPTCSWDSIRRVSRFPRASQSRAAAARCGTWFIISRHGRSGSARTPAQSAGRYFRSNRHAPLPQATLQA